MKALDVRNPINALILHFLPSGCHAHRPRPFLAYYAPLFSHRFTNNTHVGYQTRVFGEIQQDTRAGLPPEVLISFSLTINHFVPRHYTSCRELVLRARECVSPTEAVPIRSLVTGRLASGGDRTRNPPHGKRA